MKKLIPLSMLLLTALSVSGYAHSEPVSAAEGWNSSAGWSSAYERLARVEIATKIKNAEDDKDVIYRNYSYFINSYTIGNQVNITDSETGNVNAANCGSVTSQNTISEDGGGNTATPGTGNCATGEY